MNSVAIFLYYNIENMPQNNERVGQGGVLTIVHFGGLFCIAQNPYLSLTKPLFTSYLVLTGLHLKDRTFFSELAHDHFADSLEG